MRAAITGACRLRYTVAVRTLCEFTAKRGDLDLRFTPSPTAQEGIAGHVLVASRRGPGYLAEYTLAGDYCGLVVRGRADGYDPAANRLEEVKTHRGDLAAMPDNHRQLHWAQLKVYGWLLCQKLGLREVHLALVYFHIGNQQETALTETASASSLQAFFEAQCKQFLHWAEQETAHRASRNADLQALAFPHAAFRAGQHDLASAVYRAATSGRCLLAQAPTGIGKTIACVFAQLKAMPAQSFDKLFFLAAKTPGRQLALDAVRLLQASQPQLRLRTIELVARDKACEHLDKACHGESCPLAKGFYDRLPQARATALALPDASGKHGLLDRQAVRTIALDADICPYYLAQDLARWSDVVVGDYNYFFDASALLYALSTANQWRVGLLVDEAHNLPDRARAMYSAELDQAALKLLRRSAPPVLHKPLERLQRAWRGMQKQPAYDLAAAYQTLVAPPERLLLALQQTAAAIAEYLDTGPPVVDAALQRFYFDVLQFTRLADSFGTHSLFDITRPSGDTPNASTTTILCIRNVVPASFLAPRFLAARTASLFSATLGPYDYQMALLGLPPDTASVQVQSPFGADQLAVRIVTDISTRYQDRYQSIKPITDLVARQFAAAPGNYLVFVSSYDYLRQLADSLATHHPDVALWEQTRRMDEAARSEFLARFQPNGRGIGFAVLGGAFAEGIDLPGSRLVGAFIATLGLPQVNPVTQQMRQRLAEHVGASQAYAFASLIPGLQKVVQAAGRVIRGPSDRGIVFLMDDRFTEPAVQKLLPAWWTLKAVPAELAVQATEFNSAGD